MHVHHHQDEWFYVIEGELKIKIGEEIFHLKAGDSVFAPRGVPHAPYNMGGDGKGLTLFQPAGSMEDFFEELGQFKKLFELAKCMSDSTPDMSNPNEVLRR